MIEELRQCINDLPDVTNDEDELRQALANKFTDSLVRKLMREKLELVVDNTVFVFHEVNRVWTKVAKVTRRVGVKYPIVTWYSNYGKDVTYCLGENPDRCIEQMVQHYQ